MQDKFDFKYELLHVCRQSGAAAAGCIPRTE